MVGERDIAIDKLNLTPGSRLHFIGIGGSSMSGIAELALHRGYSVSGSDRAQSDAMSRLERLGASICIGHCASNITKDCALVIYTLAISSDNPEYLKAQELGVPTIERGAFLGAIAGEYSEVVAVAGTHGKTSTTSMLASVLVEAEKDPNVHLGGIASVFNSNVRTGHSDVFVTEACEYHENFLHIKPQIGIVLNVEPEHLDYFGSEDNVITSFNKFIDGISRDGVLIVCADSELAVKCARTAKCKIITYSIKSSCAPQALTNAEEEKPVCHYYASDISKPDDFFSITAGFKFTLNKNGTPTGEFCMNVPGKHNISNALAAIAASELLGCDSDRIKAGIFSFAGAGRRFDVAGVYNGAYIINDYAHHPTEIKVTIDAAKSNCKGTVWSVFQPHTYSRALRFQEEFCESFKKSDRVIVTDIYAAREPFTEEISGEMLSKMFSEREIDSVYIPDFEQIASYIKERVSEGDAVLLLGAGTINKLSSLILDDQV